MTSNTQIQPEWDESLFQDTAFFYSRYRPPIPPTVIDLIKREVRLDGGGALLDVGCGTGQMLIALHADFERLVGIDPDPQMLKEAENACESAGISSQKVILVKAGAPDLPEEQSPYRAITISRAFHWMDRPATAARAHELLEPEGSLVLLGDGSFWTGKEDWQDVVRSVVKSYLGDERRAGSSTYREPEDTFESNLHRAGFEGIRELKVADRREWNLEGILGYLYSTSFAAPHLFGDQRKAFERDLASALSKQGRSENTFVERAEFWVMIGQKPPET